MVSELSDSRPESLPWRHYPVSRYSWLGQGMKFHIYHTRLISSLGDTSSHSLLLPEESDVLNARKPHQASFWPEHQRLPPQRQKLSIHERAYLYGNQYIVLLLILTPRMRSRAYSEEMTEEKDIDTALLFHLIPQNGIQRQERQFLLHQGIRVIASWQPYHMPPQQHHHETVRESETQISASKDISQYVILKLWEQPMERRYQ